MGIRRRDGPRNHQTGGSFLTRIGKTNTAAGLFLLGLVCAVAGSSAAAQEEPNEPLIQMVIELVSGEDRDMRALGFQQVREEVPGEAATKRFAALLPKLPPDGQVGLLDALGDRRDPTARPAVLERLKSRDEHVRAAALRALGPLGGAPDVPLLAKKAAAGSQPEKAASRQSLIRLRGDGINPAIIAAMEEGAANVRIELLGVLAGRNAKENLPTVLQSAEDSDAAVRLAALGALRVLADQEHVAAIVELLKAAKGDAERRRAELALLVVCSRSRQASADDIVAGLADANVPSRIVLLRALARAGGAKALEAVVARLKDENQTVRDEAVRMLSGWPDPAVAPHLLSLAKTGESLRQRVLAIRGLVRLAGPQEDKPADLEMLAEVMNLAGRPQEKRLVLGILSGIGTLESLALVTPALDDPAVADEAGLAAVMIVEKISSSEKGKTRAAVEKVLETTENQQIRDRARKVLESL